MYWVPNVGADDCCFGCHFCLGCCLEGFGLSTDDGCEYWDPSEGLG